MKISAKIDYACRAILELALHWPNQRPLPISHIARRQHIPIKFLIHILINLKQLGLVQSVRGKEGGYTLAKAPQEINLLEIFKNFSETERSTQHHSKRNIVLDFIWLGIKDQAYKAMLETNFEEIANRGRALEKTVSFEI